MLSAANQWIVDRDRDLAGLEVLLDTDRAADAMLQCGLPLENELHIDYLRYKPGRRCISLMRTCISGTEQQFVFSALPAPHFIKQRTRTGAAERLGNCWQDPVRQIRIDRFPFDLGLKHIAKCFDSSQRSRLLRRVLGKDSRHSHTHLETLAYKPSRRFVAVGNVAKDFAAQNNGFLLQTKTEPLHTFKFYSHSQFSQTLQRLHSVQKVYSAAPRPVASHEHYRVIAMEWLQGHLLADIIASDQAADSMLFDVGSELARLHRCTPTHALPAAAAAHALDDIASYIAFISPDHAELASRTISATASRLLELRQTRTLIHGDFYAKQVLIDRSTTQHSVRFIDFDQAGLGNPYQDVGNFVAKLYWQQLALGQSISMVDELAEPFLIGYRSRLGAFDERAYRAQLSAGLIRCATHPFRRAMCDWPVVMCQLLMLAQHILEAADSPQRPVSLA